MIAFTTNYADWTHPSIKFNAVRDYRPRSLRWDADNKTWNGELADVVAFRDVLVTRRATMAAYAAGKASKTAGEVDAQIAAFDRVIEAINNALNA